LPHGPSKKRRSTSNQIARLRLQTRVRMICITPRRCAAALTTTARMITTGAHPQRGYAQRAPSDSARSRRRRPQRLSVTNGKLEGTWLGSVAFELHGLPSPEGRK
jgi:hypothetical protein